MLSPLALASLGSLLAVSGFAHYLSLIPRRKVPLRPVLTISLLSVALALTLAALGLGAVEHGLASVGPALGAGVFGWMLPLFFFYLLSNRQTPLGELKVAVGDPLLPFEARTHSGEAFHSDALAGKRVLLKFFRGQWCPYCSAELRHFEELRPQLEALDVTIVALSKDSVEDAAHNQERDNLGFTLLSDPELKVIRQYGVEHHKAIEVSKGAFTVAGVPLALVPEFKTMAIPTTLLIDERGIIRWIDQAEDYRIRSGEARVMGALRAAFDSRS